MNLKPYSSIVLSLAGIILAGMGMYFIFIRPPLLPEDMRYMASSLQNVNDNIPGLANWLQKVFYVLGGFIFTKNSNYFYCTHIFSETFARNIYYR